MKSLPRIVRRRAFTIVELCLGMITTAMVAGGVAAITNVVVLQWNDGRERQLLDVTLQQYRRAVGPIVRSARSLGGVVTQFKPGVFLWQTDTWNSAADGNAQFAEMALIEYDASTKSLLYYQADSTKLTPTSPNASTVITTAQMADANVAKLFKQQTWIKATRTLLGPGRVLDDSIVGSRVMAATFTVTRASNLQTLNLHLTVSRGTHESTIDDLFGLRAPETTTN